MLKRLSFAMFLGFAFFTFFTCENNPTESSGKVPELATSEVTDIQPTSATCGGTISSDGGSTITAKGVCWSTGQTPKVSDNKTSDGTGAGSFTSEMTGLRGGTTYYVRAYATNGDGTGYGSAMSFKTDDPIEPDVSTAEVSEITSTTAKCGGTVTSDGGSAVTSRGVCWSTDQNPTVSDSKTTNGTGTGSFTSEITGLTAGTTYYVRAYATNSAGTGYGSAMPFGFYIHETGTVIDIDGNTYQTVKIGNQWWMAENLKVTHYRNGEAIPNVTDNTAWSNLTTGAYCNYENNSTNVDTYGRLYNWYAVDDSRNIAPTGWHVPTDAEWQTLVDYLGGESVAGGKMKETGTTHWRSPNTGATNESGFSALPGGYRHNDGTYNHVGYDGHWWSATEDGSNSARHRTLYYNHSDVYCLSYFKRAGFSLRCVRD
ncbi:MAG: FISUMP domain-containing protein [archaeon]